MAVISEVKCGRCDRRYSGFRSRCPYCGARRNKRGKHGDEKENSGAKLIIGVVLLVVLIAATMVLIFSSLDKPSQASASKSPGASAAAPPSYTDKNTVTSFPGTSTSPSASASASPSASPSIDPNVKINAVTLICNGAPATDITMKIGETQTFKFTTTPASTNKVAVWETDDTNVFAVSGGKVTALGKGTATLTVTVDGIKQKCTIRVRSA